MTLPPFQRPPGFRVSPESSPGFPIPRTQCPKWVRRWWGLKRWARPVGRLSPRPALGAENADHGELLKSHAWLPSIIQPRNLPTPINPLRPDLDPGTNPHLDRSPHRPAVDFDVVPADRRCRHSRRGTEPDLGRRSTTKGRRAGFDMPLQGRRATPLLTRTSIQNCILGRNRAKWWACDKKSVPPENSGVAA